MNDRAFSFVGWGVFLRQVVAVIESQTKTKCLSTFQSHTCMSSYRKCESCNNSYDQDGS